MFYKSLLSAWGSESFTTANLCQKTQKLDMVGATMLFLQSQKADSVVETAHLRGLRRLVLRAEGPVEAVVESAR